MVDWTHWHNEPLLVGVLVLAGWGYALAVGPWRYRLAPNTPRSGAVTVRYFAGLLVFYLAVGSPLDQIGERFLFSAHMLQHMIIVNLAAPLVLSGMPSWLVDGIVDRRIARPLARFATAPVVAALTYVLCLSLWHFPAAYDAALRNKLTHVVQHLMFFAVAVLMWWPLLSPSRAAPARPPGVQVLYVFGLGILQFPLVAFLNFSREVLYPTYEYAPRLLDLTPREDQILGGTIMGIGSMFISLGLISWCFYRWYRQSESASGTAPGRAAPSAR